MITRSCPSCGVRYSYPVDECSSCRVPLVERVTESGEVVAVTEVTVPSIGHEEVPYWCALVARPQGGFALVKRDMPVKVGDTLTFGGIEESVSYTIGVLGSGGDGPRAGGALPFAGTARRVGRALARTARQRPREGRRSARTCDGRGPSLRTLQDSLTIADDAAALAPCDIGARGDRRRRGRQRSPTMRAIEPLARRRA